ncbi:MAG: hypothetical protein JWM34_3573 [Ilumatobacteraceae bacterium]|nr:hypothetical protein [Ilumatobacteraceae bacterium]
MESSRLDRDTYLTAIGRDGAAFRAAAAAGALDTPVPSCPGWDVADLVRHLADVHYFWATVIEHRATGPHDVERPEPLTDGELFAAYDARLAHLLEVLAANDPATEVWTWADDHSVGFVLRRMAIETAMHAWDAASAAGAPVPIEPTLASDGIDEFVEHMLPDIADDAEPVGGSVHIHCGDVAGEWTIRPAGDEFDVTREHAKGDCALRGDASNLLLALWRRVGAEAIDVVGDADVARRFLASTNVT